MLDSDKNAMSMSEFTNSFILFILKKTLKSSFNKMLESDFSSDSDLMSAKNKKKTLMKLIIDDFFEINIIDDSHRQILID